MTEVQKGEAIRNDIKSIGRVLFRLAARKMYNRDIPVEEQLDSISRADLKTIILRAATERSDEYYASVEQMRQDLEVMAVE